MKKINLFKKAQRKKIAIGQFNFSDISQFKGILAAAKKIKKPFILGTSEGESDFLSFKLAVSLKNIAQEELGFPIILNLDHGKSFLKAKAAIDAGYDMVHFDGSHLPLKQNIKETKKVVSYAKKKGVIVEGEIGYLGGSSKLHKKMVKIKKENMTLPEEAKFFVEKTGVNCLASAIGNIHGIYAKMPHLDLQRLNMIKNKVGKNAFLVLHGGSGVSNSEIKKAIKLGIVKININTELRLAWKKGLKKELSKKNEEAAPYKIYQEAIKTVEKVVSKKMKLFNGK